jgi:septum formation inhibitor MinC
MDREKDMLKWSEDEITLLKQHLTDDIEEVVKLFPDRTYNSVHVKWKRLRKTAKILSALKKDTTSLHKKEDELDTSKKYKHALKEIEDLTKVIEAYQATKNITVKPIIKKAGGKKTHASCVALLSDVHAGAEVLSESVFGLNEFNLEVCDKRLNNFFNIFQTKITIAFFEHFHKLFLNLFSPY